VLSALGNGGDDGWNIQWVGTYFSYVYWNATVASANPVAANLNTNQWYHVAYQYRASDKTSFLYIDGNNVITNTDTVAMPAATVSAQIGLGFNELDSFQWAGDLAHVREFDGLLSVAEIMRERLSTVVTNTRFACVCDLPLTAAGGLSGIIDRSFVHNYPSIVGSPGTFTADPPLAPPPRQLHKFLQQSIKRRIKLDGSTPAVASGTGRTTPLTSASFTPPDKSLVMVLANAGWKGTGGGTQTMVCTDSGGHTWITKASAAGATVDGGLSTVFECYFPTSPGAITVSIAYAGFGASSGGGRQADILVYTGAAADQSAAATATALFTTGTACTANITTTQPDSYVVGAISEVTNSTATFTPNGNTLTDNTLTDSTDGDKLIGIIAIGVAPTPASYTFGGTWSASVESNLALVEIIPEVAAPTTTLGPAGIPSGELDGSASVTAVSSPAGVPGGVLAGNPSPILSAAVAGVPSGELAGSASAVVVVSPASGGSSEALGAVLASVAAAPAGIRSAEQLGTPTGTVVTAPAAVPSGELDGLPAITVVAAPASLGSVEQLGTPSGTVVATQAGIAGAETPGAASAVAVVASLGIRSAEQLGTPTGTVVTAPAAIGSSEALGVASGVAAIAAAGILTSELAGAIAALVVAAPAGVLSEQRLGNQGTAAALAVSGVPSAELAGAIAATLIVASSGVGTGQALGAGLVASLDLIFPAGIPGLERLPSPALVVTLSPASAPSAERAGSSSTVLIVPPVGVFSGERLSSGTVIAAVSPAGIRSGEVTSTPVIAVPLATLLPSSILSALALGEAGSFAAPLGSWPPVAGSIIVIGGIVAGVVVSGAANSGQNVAGVVTSSIEVTKFAADVSIAGTATNSGVT
jgi:hypothetical protein